jgi:serine/threonine-protein kinase
VQFRARFERESRLAAAIDHPNIIPVYEAGAVDGRLFIAMRYVAGIDLGQLLAGNGPLGRGRTVAVMGQVGRALDAAHRAGLVHRDVKPGNVMLDLSEGGEHCYLTDFGLTKNVKSSSGYTETGQFVGTLNYMAPEQIEGRHVDSRADLYSFGCMLFECLAGVPPFRRDSDIAMMYAHLHEPPPSVRTARPELPESVDNVLVRAMAKAPADRHASCAAAVAELRVALGGGQLPAFQPSAASTGRRFTRPPVVNGAGVAAAAPPPSGLPTRGAPPASPPPASLPPYVPPPTAALPPPSAPPQSGKRRQRGYFRPVLIVAIAVLLCAGAVTAAFVLSDNSGNTPQQERQRLIERTVILHRELVTVTRQIDAKPGRVDDATKARLKAYQTEARKLADEILAQKRANAAGYKALSAAIAKLTLAVDALNGYANNRQPGLPKGFWKWLDDARKKTQAAKKESMSGPVVTKPTPSSGRRGRDDHSGRRAADLVADRRRRRQRRYDARFWSRHV